MGFPLGSVDLLNLTAAEAFLPKQGKSPPPSHAKQGLFLI